MTFLQSENDECDDRTPILCPGAPHSYVEHAPLTHRFPTHVIPTDGVVGPLVARMHLAGQDRWRKDGNPIHTQSAEPV
jgi:hypothetical protein